jgi:hypothetical protein
VGTFRKKLLETKTDKYLARLINEHLQAFGPRKLGSNLLINLLLPPEESILGIFDRLVDKETKFTNSALSLSEVCSNFQCSNTEVMNGILNGFNHATISGPLCEEEI